MEKIRETLTRKFVGLPMWTWGVGALIGLAAFIYFKRQSSATGDQSPGAAQKVAPGFGYNPPLPYPTNPMPTPLPPSPVTGQSTYPGEGLPSLPPGLNNDQWQQIRNIVGPNLSWNYNPTFPEGGYWGKTLTSPSIGSGVHLR